MSLSKEENRFLPIERLFATVLSRFPRLKLIIKFLYQLVFASISEIKESRLLVERTFGQAPDSCFFGYYDNCPENSNGDVIYHVVNHLSSKFDKEAYKTAEICIASSDGVEEYVATTTVFNFQQGSKLQWISDDRVIFNDYDEALGILISRVVNPFSKEVVKSYSRPVYDVYESEFFVFLNYNRLRFQNYDYAYSKFDNWHGWSKEDGLYHHCMVTDKSNILVSYEKIRESLDCSDIKGFKHDEINHALISPDGQKIIFIYRYYNRRGRNDALFIVNIKSRDIKMLNKGMCSHFVWIDGGNIIGYMEYHGMRDYFHYSMSTQKWCSLNINQMIGCGDGHPYHSNGKLVFDTYPDRKRQKHLYIFDLHTRDIKKIASVYEPLRFKTEERCDLHPRFSRDGRFVYIDSNHNGHRSLIKVRLNEI